MKVKELLPIGSVVLLEGAEKRIMIFGVKQTDAETGMEYDYIGVLYPEGNVGVEGQLMFNHANIEKVFFRGFEDEERNDFLKLLEQYYEQR